jgi:hypothetical protein
VSISLFLRKIIKTSPQAHEIATSVGLEPNPSRKALPTRIVITSEGIVAWIVIASVSEAISYPRSNVFMAFLQEFQDCHVVYFVDTPRNDDPRNNATSECGWLARTEGLLIS